jgi:hypothetical protein
VEHFANGYVVFQLGFTSPPDELADFLNQLSLMALVPQQVRQSPPDASHVLTSSLGHLAAAALGPLLG